MSNHDAESRPYVEALRTDGCYATPAGGRRAWWPTPSLHARLMWIYLRAGRSARRREFDASAYALASYRCFRAVEAVGGRVTVTGLENLAAAVRRGPVVGIGNHMSVIETLLLPGCFYVHTPVAFVIKQSLLDYPVFGPIMRAVPYIAVGRAEPRQDLRAVLEQGAAWLRRGTAVMVFPQATRHAWFEPGRFNTLGVKLAARAGALVVPVALCTDFLAPGRMFKDFGTVHPDRPIRIAFGPPQTVEGNGRAAQAATVAFIEAAMRDWGVPIRYEESQT